MKVLVFGAGVQGSYLAHKLVKGGNNVTVLARGKRVNELKENGVVVRHYLQRKTTKDKVNVIKRLESDDVYDVIFVTMKYTDFPAVLPTLSKNKSNNIVLVGNNIRAREMEEKIKTNSVNKKNIAFGFQINGGKKDKEKIISIQGKGKMVINSLDNSLNMLPLLKDIFRNSGYNISYEKDIDAWLKSHMALILGQSAAQYINDNDTVKLAKNNKDVKRLVYAVDEGLIVLESLNYSVMPKLQVVLFRKHKGFVKFVLKLFLRLPVSNMFSGSIAEIIGLYDTFVEMKKNSNVETPNLDSLIDEVKIKYLTTMNEK